MQAAYDVGIRQLVSDTSVAGQDNPSPNAGIWNALRPGGAGDPALPDRPRLQRVDSRPSGSPQTTTATRRRSQLRADRRRRERRPGRGTCCAATNDPWMFHQANTRDYGGGRSLLGDLLGATIDQVRRSGDVSDRQPEHGRAGGPGDGSDAPGRVRRRRDDSARRHADRPGQRTPRRSRSPACARRARRSTAGRRSPTSSFAAGGSMTLSLTDCNPGSGGAGGAGGAAGGRNGRRG